MVLNLNRGELTASHPNALHDMKSIIHQELTTETYYWTRIWLGRTVAGSRLRMEFFLVETAAGFLAAGYTTAPSWQ